jgi:hypothetical protein
MKISTSYRDVASLKRQLEWIGGMVEAHGVPLEILNIVNGRVYSIDALDYVEGEDKPLMMRGFWWKEALVKWPLPPAHERLPGGLFAVYPDGTWETLAE